MRPKQDRAIRSSLGAVGAGVLAAALSFTAGCSDPQEELADSLRPQLAGGCSITSTSSFFNVECPDEPSARAAAAVLEPHCVEFSRAVINDVTITGPTGSTFSLRMSPVLVNPTPSTCGRFRDDVPR